MNPNDAVRLARQLTEATGPLAQVQEGVPGIVVAFAPGEGQDPHTSLPVLIDRTTGQARTLAPGAYLQLAGEMTTIYPRES